MKRVKFRLVSPFGQVTESVFDVEDVPCKGDHVWLAEKRCLVTRREFRFPKAQRGVGNTQEVTLTLVEDDE